MQEYYSLPLNFEAFLEKKQHSRCSLRQSIAQNIFIMLTSNFEESRYDPEYGCSIWDNDFDMMTNIKWKDNIRISIERVVKQSEGRLSQVTVQVEVEDFEVYTKTGRKIRKKLNVKIEGLIRKTNERFLFEEYLFIAPMATA
jgi:predicted component of type VI protein secretion system